jgi:hypothetical protein
MNPTQEQYDELAKVFQAGSTGDENGWENLAIDPDYMSEECLPVATRETIDDFRDAAKNSWNETSKCEKVPGGLYWPHVQALKGQPRVALAIIDCGEFRLTYQQ